MAIRKKCQHYHSDMIVVFRLNYRSQAEFNKIRHKHRPKSPMKHMCVHPTQNISGKRVL